MKTAIVRILIRDLLFSIIAGVVVAIIGLLLGWRTSTQFSDGFFWAGVIMFAIGFISLRGASQHTPDWPPINLDPTERASLLAADTLRGKNIAIFFGISGLLMLGLSFLALSLS